MPGDEITILLTRPQVQSERFAGALAKRLEGVPVRIAPVIEIVPLPLPPLPDDAGALIFTSENGVEAFAQQSARRELPAWCVGERTAEVARAAGFAARASGGDAEALLRDLTRERPAGRLVHVRGRHAAGRLAARLGEAGLPVAEVVAYDQRPTDPGATLGALLARPGRVVAPLFSPRSARLLAEAVATLPGDAVARLVPLAISAAAAKAWREYLDGPMPEIALRPDAEAMCAAVEAAVQAIRDAGARPA